MTFPYTNKQKNLPEGWYDLEIVKAEEGLTKKGDRCVITDLEVIDSLAYDGIRIPRHYVNFLPPTSKGAFMAIHFLKAIGEPWEGDFVVDAAHWIGKGMRAYVYNEKSADGQYENLRLKWIKPYVPVATIGQEQAPIVLANEEEEVPF